MGTADGHLPISYFLPVPMDNDGDNALPFRLITVSVGTSCVSVNWGADLNERISAALIWGVHSTFIGIVLPSFLNLPGAAARFSLQSQL